MNEATRRAITEALSVTLQRLSTVHGGDINEAWLAETSEGTSLFIKTNPQAPPHLFDREARGLAWLRDADALTIPKVLAVGHGAGPAAFLALEHLKPGQPVANFDVLLGEGLAKLHAHSADQFGLDHDNFIGSLPQSNTPHPTWADFYGHQRLGAQLKRARDQGLATKPLIQAVEALIMKLPERVGDEEPPARLHGDLWSGNLHRTQHGRPALIDPAVYGGHREVDLAMMRLFGGFSDRVFEAYHATYPLAPGHQERVGLYQLYPLLVHLNLFGGHYGQSALRTAQRYL